jgi:hypothetical protein
MSQALDLNSIAQSAVRARGDLPGIVKTFFGCLDAREVLIVRKAVRASQSPAVHAAAAFINHLGNGWLYLASPSSARSSRGQARGASCSRGQSPPA